MPDASSPTLLVTGASGQLGRRAVALLQEMYSGPIVAATRTPDALAAVAQQNLTIRRADFEDTDSLDEAFAGVDRLLLISTDATDVPGRRIQQHKNAIEAAERAGVKHIVYTSIIHSGPQSPAYVVPDHRATEDALAESGMGWTILRENIYTDLHLYSLTEAIRSGTLTNAIGSGKASYITRDDCARAAVAALTMAFDDRRTLDITGPNPISQEQLAEFASRLSGKDVRYVPVDLDTMIQNMMVAGLPRPVAEGYASFDAAIAQGEFNVVSSAVQDLTGRMPQSVQEFLTHNQGALQSAAGR